jgi:hypothetical protein
MDRCNVLQKGFGNARALTAGRWSIRYSRIEDVEAALPKAIFDREAIPTEAAFLAGKTFLFYRRHGERFHH